MQAQPAPGSRDVALDRPVRRRGRRRALRRPPFVLLAPTLILLLVIVAIPFVIGVYTSVTDLNQHTITHWSSAPFIGLQNYVDGFTATAALGATLLQSIWASVSFSLMTTVLIIPIGIVAALLMNTSFRGRSVVRTIFLIPFVMPVFVNAITWRLLFMSGWGPIDRALAALHLAGVNTYWLIGPNSFWAMVMADVWASWPFVYLMTLAGLQQISRDLYEAAAIDGASGWRSFFAITAPLLRPIFGLAVLLSTINHFNNFTLPFVMFGTPPPVAVDVLPLNIYVTSFQLFDLGQGAAMSFVALLVMLVPAIFYIRLVRLGEQSL